MKVYAVFSGAYSDRGLDNIFSTKEKAEKYIEYSKKMNNNYSDVDDKPTEIEIDKFDYPKHVMMEMNLVNNKGWICYDKQYGEYSHEEGIFIDGTMSFGTYSKFCYAKVKYNKDFSVMEKSANDKLAMFKAIDEGI